MKLPERHTLTPSRGLRVLLVGMASFLFFSRVVKAQPNIEAREKSHVASVPAMAFPGDPFTKITEGEIVNDGQAASTGCSWVDYDNDGDLDLYSTNYGHDNFFYVNNGDGTFTKITATLLIHPGNSNAATWADYDNDGDLDVIVANDGNYQDMESIFLNNGDGTFEQNVTDPIANDGGSSQGICWGDYDNDGQLDLFIPNGFSLSQNNFLYHSNGDGTFTRILTGSIVNDGGRSRSASWGDIDNDGDLDLFVTNSDGENNFLYINNGDGSFAKDSTSVVANDGGQSRGSCWADADNDGDIDLFVTNADGQNNFFYVNNSDGTFSRDTTSILANDGGVSIGSSWADYDNDGDIDLFVANVGQNNFFYENNGNGTFTKNTTSIISNEGSQSQVCAWGDYDNDGHLDLFVSNGYANDYLYRNNGNSNSWINVLCVGTLSNRSAIGARVWAKATINGFPVWQIRDVEGQSGQRSQNSLNVEFGFGDAAIIDSLIIEWPSGIIDISTSVGVSQFVTAIEGQGIITAVGSANPQPERFGLKQNYPNPFNPSTRIRYSIPQSSHVTLKVYDMLGREVETLVNEEQVAGGHEAIFQPKGKATGAYFYRLQAGSFVETKKLVLVK